MTWWQRLTHRTQMEEQLAKELRFHLEQHTADLIARGCDPEAARRQAKLALGGPEQVKEDCRDARGTRWLEDLSSDFRYALRTLRQKPGFAVVALVTLALGIGSTTVMFTVIDGVLLRPLPYREPDRLVRLHGYSDNENVAIFRQQNVAHFDFLDIQRQSRSIELTGWVYNGGTFGKPEPAEYVDNFEASSNLFSVIGVPLFRGRAFLPEEDCPGGSPVAILGYSFWHRHYAGNLSAIGKDIVFDGKHYTVVGIAAPGFKMGGDEADVYTPMGQDTARFMQDRQAHPVTVIARLRSGATLAQAQAELALIGRHLAEQYPKTNKDRTFRIEPLRPDVGDARSTLWLLFGAVGVVLLIACVNVASLLLARAVSRSRELAMRIALGASRGRIARQCLTESAVLGISGGLLGTFIGAFAIHPFVVFWPGSLPRAEEVQLDWRVLLFAVCVSLLSGFLFGLAPALRAPAHQLEQTLHAGARTAPGSSRRLHNAFVISEIGLAIVLLVCAGMLGRTLLRLSSLDPGVNVHNVLTARTALSPDTLANPAKIRSAWQDILDRARRVPGVQSVATVDTVPMREGFNPIGYGTTRALPPENQQPVVSATCVSPDYLKVMSITLRKGRFFNGHDRIDSELVAVIDDVMAREAFGKQDPIGKQLWLPDMGTKPVRVVGVVNHVRYWGPAIDDEAQVRAQLYYLFAQVPDGLLRRWSELMSIAVRTGVPPLNVVEPLRQEIRGATADQVLYDVHTMEQLAASTLARHRFLLLLFVLFAGLAMLLACIGIYGVLAYLTNQRVPEIGVRMALGANARDVVRLVLRHSFVMISSGVAMGAVAAFAACHVLQRSVDGMRAAEPLTFAVMICLLIMAALMASYLPARRASRIDPMTALRQE